MSNPIRSTDHDGFACDFRQSQGRSAPCQSYPTSLPRAATNPSPQRGTATTTLTPPHSLPATVNSISPSSQSGTATATAGALTRSHSSESSTPYARTLTPWLPSTTPFDVVNIATLNTNNAQVLGQGGQGIARRIHTPQGTMVLKEDLVTVDPKYYVQEMAIAAELLGCPNVVQYRAVIVKRGDTHSDVMVPCGWLMEDLGDVTLHKWVRDLSKQPSTMTEAAGSALAKIISDVATGLQALHHRGLVHMDVKPANIVVTSHGTAKLIDLGLVERAATTRSRAGTHGFRAPEVASDETVMPTPASDMWSLGATLRWCLTALDARETSPSWAHLWSLADDLQQDVAVVRPTPDVVINTLKPKDGGHQFNVEAQMRQAVVLLQAARRFTFSHYEEVAAKLIDYSMGNRTLPIAVLCKALLTTAQRLLQSEDGRAWHCARELSSVLLNLARADTDDVLHEHGIDFDANLLWLDVRIQSGTTALIQEARRDALAMMQQVTDYDRRLQLRTRMLQMANAGSDQHDAWDANHNESFASPSTTVAYLSAQANALQKLGDRENLLKALALYDDELRIKRATLGDNHPSIASTLGNKANALGDLGGRENLLKALALYDEELRIMCATLSDNHPSVASALVNKVLTLRQMDPA